MNTSDTALHDFTIHLGDDRLVFTVSPIQASRYDEAVEQAFAYFGNGVERGEVRLDEVWNDGDNTWSVTYQDDFQGNLTLLVSAGSEVEAVAAAEGMFPVRGGCRLVAFS